MKKLMFVLVALFIGGGTISAQDQDRDRDRVDQEEHLVLRDGIMLQIKDGDQVRLQDKITLHDGTVVNPDGTYQLKDRQQLRLQDGECLDMEGNKYRTQEMFRLELAKRNGDHFMFKDGAMWQLKDGNQVKLQAKVSLQNGATIDPNGTYQVKDRKQLRLQDGECLDMEGKKYRTQEMFRQDFDKRMDRDRIRDLDRDKDMDRDKIKDRDRTRIKVKDNNK